jgi:6-phosphogluconolactonase
MTAIFVYVGSYPDSPNPGGGGVTAVSFDPVIGRFAPIEHHDQPAFAGYLAVAPALDALYVVDERKTDGRGPVEAPAAVHAFRIGRDGRLAWINSLVSPGPRPSYVSVNADRLAVITANHGDFQHVERVVRQSDGTWGAEYVYDDSTVVLFGLNSDGSLGHIRDVHVCAGYGSDPNSSPQNGGHAQASAHAHCAEIDPSGRYVVVCDKGTDEIHTFTYGERLELVATLRLPPESGPRHLAFDRLSNRAFATLEFASELASFTFDQSTGTFELVDQVTTLAAPLDGRVNEPADIGVHPSGRFVYVNNRGEDTLAWFDVDSDGRLRRLGDVPLAESIHPGLAARSFCFDATGELLLVADRPANLLRAYTVDATTGAPSPMASFPIINPACVLIADVSVRRTRR